MYKIFESSNKEFNFIDNKLRQYNKLNVPYDLSVSLSEFNRNIKDDNGNIIAGINCTLNNNAWKCIYIEALWVDEKYRGKTIGSYLLKEIEKTAKKYHCHLIHLNTFDFQAKNFYIKHGYEIHGVLENCPKGHKKYYLHKDIHI